MPKKWKSLFDNPKKAVEWIKQQPRKSRVKPERADHWTWKIEHLKIKKPKKQKLDEKAMGTYHSPHPERTQIYGTERQKHKAGARLHARTFHAEHHEAVEEYKRESSVFNRPLRGGYDNEDEHHHVIHYLDHVTSGKTDHHIIAWRSVSRELKRDLEIGSTFKDDGYSGLSFNRHTALEFAKLRRPKADDDEDDEDRLKRAALTVADPDEARSVGIGKPVIARIHVPRGSRGHYIDHTVPNEHDHEREFLLHRGTTFKVHGHTESDDVHIVHLSVHKQEEHIPPKNYRGEAPKEDQEDDRQSKLPLEGGKYFNNLKNPHPKKERVRYPSDENLPVDVKQRWKPKLKSQPGDSYAAHGEIYKKMNFSYFDKKKKPIGEGMINEVDKETLETQYRNWGYWDGKADKEVGAFPGKARFSKDYVYRALPAFQRSYWDGYYAGYYERSFNPLKEDILLESGLVVAHKHPDGRVQYGKPGQVHYDLGIRNGEDGFAEPGGKFMARDEAIKWVDKKEQATSKRLKNRGYGRLEANDYKRASIKEEAPINNVGAGQIAGVGISNPDKPTMWGEPGFTKKQQMKHRLRNLLRRKRQ